MTIVNGKHNQQQSFALVVPKGVLHPSLHNLAVLTVKIQG
jgi:hypothetical protein